MRDLAVDVIKRYQVRAPGPHTEARKLSGGNLQKVVLAREFSGEPVILIAASPTRGLDVSAIETVHTYLLEAAERGVAVLLISEDLDEILALADRRELRVRGHRRRRARALQPVRGRARRVPARRPAERGVHAAGSGLPGRARRGDAGPDPLLRARR
jgi:ABC-type dipeptide/oligopeptide/nickel transport system ATPase subunit